MSKPLTIIIAAHNEGEQLVDTLQSLYNSADVKDFDVIVIDDGSERVTDIQKKFPDLLYIWKTKQSGVGTAFDDGVYFSRTPYVVLMGSDIRFPADQNWLPIMLDEVKQHPKSIICTNCLGLNADTGKMDPNDPSLTDRYGADIQFFITPKDLPDGSRFKGIANWRNIIQARWRRAYYKVKESYEVPCVLGAFYITSKNMYNFVNGFKGHKIWGTLEPHISLKYWFSGGSCRVVPHVNTAHIFKSDVNHLGSETWIMDYNKLYVAKTMFSADEYDAFNDHLGSNSSVDVARAALAVMDNQIDLDRELYHSNFVRDFEWFKERFPLMTNYPH